MCGPNILSPNFVTIDLNLGVVVSYCSQANARTPYREQKSPRSLETVQLKKERKEIHSTFTNYSAIHKATGLTVPGHSMILTGTIPETPTSHECSCWQEQVCEVVPTRRTPGPRLCE